jgi:hypothetical protein
LRKNVIEKKTVEISPRATARRTEAFILDAPSIAYLKFEEHLVESVEISPSIKTKRRSLRLDTSDYDQASGRPGAKGPDREGP